MNVPTSTGRGSTRSHARGAFLALCATIAMGLGQPAAAAGIDYPIGQQYKFPTRLPVKATAAEIAQLDADTQAVVDQLKAGSPTAVDYASRAFGVLIFPKVETSNYFLIGETKALGVLYVKDPAGAYQKASYYLGQRNSLGFITGSQSSSRVIMFMKEDALKGFIEGDVTASYMGVNPETGAVEGNPDADVAVFITNVEGEPSGVSFKGLEIAPVTFTE